ncbi:MAG: hypothetical protein ACRDZR_18255 [Acidimicrobiales bacterium]
MPLPIEPLAAASAAVARAAHHGRLWWPSGHLVGAGPSGHGARLADVSMTPDPGQLPGGSTLQQLTDGVGGWALILSLVGMVAGAGAWALGAHSQNFHQSFIGRRTVLISGLAALVIGAAPALVNFFFHAGRGVH